LPSRGSAVFIYPAAVTKTFAAVLERMPGNLGWVIIRVPVDVHKTWGVKGQLRVRGDVNGYEFRTSLFPTGKGWHYLLVNKKMQQGGVVRAGQKAKFRLEPDLAKRVIVQPDEWKRILKQSRAISKFCDSLSYSDRRELAKWVSGAKAAASRRKRADHMAERILETIDAERELPPLLRRAFDANPQALRGWERMTPNQRRHHLLGIFYYRNPDSRLRRLDKVIAEALRRAEKA
jgi:uncharacterized protein YdeI (YjbR/CyaY-like superfamily)